MQLRRFEPGDESFLRRVYYSAVHQIASRDYRPEQVAAWAPVEYDVQAWGERMRTINPFVVEVAGEIVGYADVQASGYINHFFVSGNWPGKGIGRLLMSRLHQEAETLGLAEMTADVSKTAEPFFAKYGFDVLERRAPVRLGVVIHNALMRKTLAGET